MNARIVRTIFFKELLDTFRDKRTLIAMVGVPILLYPLLFILGTQLTIVQQSRMDELASRVAVTGAGADTAAGWFDGAEGVETVESAAPMDALTAGDVDAVVDAPENVAGTLSGDGTAEIVLHFDNAEARSRAARDRVSDVLGDLRRKLVAERIARAGLAPTFAQPIDIESKNVAPATKSTGSLLGTVLPLIMVVMLGVGAFYPAVDLTAGEKERGTFETLLSTPVSKLEIVTGKFLTVFTLSAVTGALNLASMIATVVFQLSQFFASAESESTFIPSIEIPPATALIILGVLVPLAFFIAALMMTVALLARSFREAQNYVSPFFMAIVLPAGAPSVPGIELDRVTQFIPIANVSLLFRELLMGDVRPDMAFFVFVSTATYALLALLLAAWMFQREDVVLSQESVAPITWDRRSLAPSDAPTPGIALAIFGAVMLLIFYAGTALQGWRLHAGLALTQYGVILLPVLFALWFGKVNLRTALNLRVPSIPALAGTLVLAAAWTLLSIEFSLMQSRILPPPPEMEDISKRLFDLSALPGGLFTLLAIIAVSPAICEESLFRGVLLSGLRRRLPAWVTVLAVGLLFGAFHLSIYRFVPTALSGILFTYLALRTGSIVTSALAHFTLNALAILVETQSLPEPIVAPLHAIDPVSGHVPAAWLAGAAAVFVVGIAIVEFSARRRSG